MKEGFGYNVINSEGWRIGPDIEQLGSENQFMSGLTISYKLKY
jgi:hypothetical protein